MDRGEIESGLIANNFWHKAKVNLIKILLNKIGEEDVNILNIGVDTGNDLNIINKFGNVTSINIDKKALVSIPKKLYKKIVCDATEISLQDSHFEIVVALDVFEHIHNDTKVFNEVERVLKKGGFLILTVPAFQFLFSSYDVCFEHFRRYNKSMINKKLRKAGFHMIFFSYWNFFLFAPFVIERLYKKIVAHKSYKNTLTPFLNNLFYKILNVENRLIKFNIKLPIGLTICGIYKK